jgi:hypothetical protein
MSLFLADRQAPGQALVIEVKIEPNMMQMSRKAVSPG